MGFERFEKKGSGGSRVSQTPRLSLRKSGTIGINAAGVDEFFDDSDWVILYYDKKNRLIGLEPKSEESGNTYKIRKSKKEGHGAQINCRAFTREYGIIPDKTTRYDLEQDDKDRMVIVDLDEPVKKIDSSG